MVDFTATPRVAGPLAAPPADAAPFPPPLDLSLDAPPDPPPKLDSGQLFGDRREVHIQHGELVYRLRITALGKLILTK